ncbi:16324_t:CDS:2 [Gigaspora margarita]|uniref:16324_t:CDS:1 n=1 Tax=Gigaspora margarita TaxID=4874 RepID=A0ABM8W588_GIGMA|nr:16324_t:CDS:2 [Gigaspora margarita]
MALEVTDICKIIAAVFLPPLGVFFERGCGTDLLINILLTLLGYIPGKKVQEINNQCQSLQTINIQTMDDDQWVHAKPISNEYSNETNDYESINIYSNVNSYVHSKQFKRSTFNKRTQNKRKTQNNRKETNLRQYYQPQHIEFHLASVSINEYQETIDTVNEYKLRFRYKYLEEGISIFLNENKAKIYIPIDALEAISKVQHNLLVLTLKKDCSNLISYASKDGFVNDDPIRENLSRASSISMIAQEKTPQQAIDMAGLHIHYLVNRNNKYKANKTHIGEDFLIKCHVDDNIRILRFKSNSQFEEIKHTIIDTFNVRNITKFYYKDDDGEYITIVNTADFDTASKLYKKDNRLEIWCMTGRI